MDPIVLVLGADHAFTMALAVTLHSALYYLDQSRSVVVYLFTSSLSTGEKERIRHVAERSHPNAQMVWCKPRSESLRSLNTTRQYSAAIYYRLLVPETLPLEVNAAIGDRKAS